MIGNTDPNSARSESIRSKETVAINSDEFPLDSLLPEWFVEGEGCRTDVRGTFVIVSAVCAKVCQRSQLPGCPPPAGRHPWFALPGFFTGRAMLPPSGDNRLTCGLPDFPAAPPPSPPPLSAFRAVHRFRSAVNSLGSLGLSSVPWVRRFLPRVTGDHVKVPET